MAHIGRYVLAGILTVIPLWVTWLVVDFVCRQLLRIGSPIVAATREQLTRRAPELAERISSARCSSSLTAFSASTAEALPTGVATGRMVPADVGPWQVLQPRFRIFLLLQKPLPARTWRIFSPIEVIDSKG